MLHIKKTVLLLLCCGFLFSANAQTEPQDYNNIKPFSGSSAFRKFSIGVNIGALNPSVIIGGTNNFYNPQTTFGYGANLRYQFNHYIGLQLDYLGGTLKGNQNGWPGAATPLVSSFKTNLASAFDLAAVFTFGNINFLKMKNSIIPYITAGLGTASYKVKIVKAGSTTEEDFDNGNTENNVFAPIGVGLKFNLSQLMNLDLGYRMNFVDKDNLDGYEVDYHKDKFSYGFIGLEFSLGKQQKPRMLFDNPVARLNNNLQTQIDTISNQVKGLSTDTDGDGVPDRFDKEPNTPAGCPVDAHGVSRDTDGDGVPDCKDKELVTPTQCQPVDADGVGKCPEPDCCKAIRDTLAAMNACNLNLPSITFKSNRTTLTSDAKAMLATVASQMKSSANCKIVITGYPAASKASQASCNKRLQTIQSYLTETEGISADRIQTNCQVGGGDVNTVDLLAQ
jgi:opacity protein-like surface antigen/outer membrane protein OmpA-like peptidoglycan-associated protein